MKDTEYSRAYLIIFQVFRQTSVAIILNPPLPWTYFDLYNLMPSQETPRFFNVEQSSSEKNPPCQNTPAKLNSKELSGAFAREVNTISSVSFPEPHIVTIESEFSESTNSYRYERQEPINPLAWMTLTYPWTPTTYY